MSSDHSSVLLLDSIEIIGDMHSDSPAPSLVDITKMAKNGSEGKCLRLWDVQFSDDTTAASFFSWLRSQGRLKLDSIDLAYISALESENICDCLASNPDARIKHFRLFDVPLHRSPASTYEALFQNFQLGFLEFHSCSVDLPSLTGGLRKQSPVQTLSALILCSNALGQCPDADLQAFFDVIFSLPEPEKLALDLEKNDLNVRHLELLCNSWREANTRRHSVVLADLSIQGPDLPEPDTIPGLRDVANNLSYRTV